MLRPFGSSNPRLLDLVNNDPRFAVIREAVAAAEAEADAENESE